MSFTVIIPAGMLEAANATLAGFGHGPGNFFLPLRPTDGDGEATHVALHHYGNDAGFQAACASLPWAVVQAAPNLTVAFSAHCAAEALEWTDPTFWFLDPIMLGDQRTHGGKLWESLVDYNVWTPPVNWREIVGEGYPAWVQPTGAQDAYPLGARVTHNGQDWENTGSAANVWEPGVFGWVVV